MTTRVDYDTVAATYGCRYTHNEYAGVGRAVTAWLARPPEAGPPAVLDVACGTGHWLARLQEADVRAVGIDLSAGMLDKARAGVSGARLIRARAEELPFDDGRFDRLICINAIHHFTDAATFFREARRVLGPQSAILVVGLDPHTERDRWWVYDYFPGALIQDRKRYLSASRIRELMTAAGFTRCETREVEHFRKDLSLDEANRRGLLERTSTSQLMVIAETEYRSGLDRLRSSASASGPPVLRVNLRLYGTIGWIGE